MSLKEDIIAWTARGAEFLTRCSLEEALQLPRPNASPRRRIDSVPVQDWLMPLPSLCEDGDFGYKGYERMAKIELMMQQGKCRDLLHDIRMNIVKRAVIFRQTVRFAKSVGTYTRAMALLAAAKHKLQGLLLAYNEAQERVAELAPDPAVVEEYRPLSFDDIVSTTTAVDHTRPGHRFSTLPWFWTHFVDIDKDSTDYMTECECPPAGRRPSRLLSLDYRWAYMKAKQQLSTLR